MPGAGSTFWFTAPIAHPPDEEEPHLAASVTDVNVADYLRAN
jgi:hypothetical protein